MYLITPKYFISDIHIPNLEEICNSNMLIYHQIITWQEECLRLILGDCLYNEFLQQLEFKNDKLVYDLKDGVNEKWSWLLYGRTYELSEYTEYNRGGCCETECGCGCHSSNCNKHHWDGLIRVRDMKIPITNENNEKVPTDVQIRESLIAYYVYYNWTVYNKTLTAGAGEQLPLVKNSTRTTNTEKKINAWNKFWEWYEACSKHGKVSLKTFIKEHIDFYPEWDGVCLDHKNYWSL